MICRMLCACRYIDDIYFTWHEPLDRIQRMFDKINAHHPNINLVRQIGSSVSFLDVQVNNKTLETSVYFKEATEPSVLPLNSDHSKHC
jgi:hypothetical protein